VQDILRRDDLSGEDIAEQQESNWVFRCLGEGGGPVSGRRVSSRRSAVNSSITGGRSDSRNVQKA